MVVLDILESFFYLNELWQMFKKIKF